MIVNYMLEKVLPNPYQTRESEDLEHILNLAQSISAQGLLQIPSARIAPGQQGRNALKDSLVQLVFGHSRLAAFKHLCESGVKGFSTIPLNIVEMSDEEMFAAAVAENRERKDLTPIEEARAMLVYRDQFKKNSEEIGKLFHLSDSAVRNKLRLLDLPAEMQERVGRTLTEGAAREVLTLLSLPESALQHTYWHRGESKTARQALEDSMVESLSTEEAKSLVDNAVMRAGTRLERKQWKHTDELVGEGIIGLCKGCELMITRDGVDYCMNSACFEAKEKAFRQQYLSQASLLSGIAILDDDKYGYGAHTEFGYGKEAALEGIREKRCENLRLKFGGYYGLAAEKVNHLAAEGFGHAEIVCCKANGQCTCLKAKEAGVEVGGGSEEDLKAARRQMLQQKRFEAELIKHMNTSAATILTEGLYAMRLQAWKTVLQELTYSNEIKDASTMNGLMLHLSELVVSKVTWGDKNNILKQLNELLERCGFEKLDISFGEEGELPDDSEPGECVGGFVEPEVHGKTLIEVFEEEE